MAGNGRASADSLLVAALASGASAEEAARRAKCSPRTVFRRKADPTFQAAVAAARAELVTETMSLLIRSGTAAAVALARLLGSNDERTRLHAAKAILEAGTRLREAHELEQRIAQLEASQTNGGSAWPR